jgi:hypothetical protein
MNTSEKFSALISPNVQCWKRGKIKVITAAIQKVKGNAIAERGPPQLRNYSGQMLEGLQMVEGMRVGSGP